MLGSETNFRRRLLRWYDRARRDLPWRSNPALGRSVDAYQVLISEAMLQQTQVATVIPYFHRFLDRFPTLESLAAAHEQDVLRCWQGLGYYSRARNLLAAARKVVSEFGGQLPSRAEQLLELPGIGRYTAGAIASIAFDRRSPILDGNVTRVLCRLDRIENDPRQRATQELLWSRAAEILPRQRCGDFNSALMELGATVCTPRSPVCLLCPVRQHCKALADGVQEKIPLPKRAVTTPLLRRATYCIRHGAQYLIEQRPPRGRWAGMWQFVTIEPGNAKSGPLPVPTNPAHRLGLITHALTHRRYEFEVFVCESRSTKLLPAQTNLRWTTLENLTLFPLPRPHLRIAEMLSDSKPRPAGGR